MCDSETARRMVKFIDDGLIIEIMTDRRSGRISKSVALPGLLCLKFTVCIEVRAQTE